MNVFHLLTAVLVVLQLTGVIAISWLFVFMPSVILFLLSFIVLFTVVAVALGKQK